MYSLRDLQTELRWRAARRESRKSIIDLVASLAKSRGIRMRVDKCTPDVPVSIKRGMLQIDFEPNRIFLSRGRSNEWRGLGVECNGVVIDTKTWSLLSIPPRAFARDVRKSDINRALAVPDEDETGNYSVVQALDGTVVTIYGWMHPKKGLIWCLASANGYDVSHLKWGGEKTYAEAVFELLAKHHTLCAMTGLELVWGVLSADDVRLNFRTLDQKRCYTIGFRHPNFHPMTADPPGVWNIQSVNLVSGVTATDGLPGVPNQATYDISDLNRLLGRYRRPMRVEDLESISQTALDDAKEIIAGKMVPSLLSGDEWTFATSFNYGFILRSKKPLNCPDILIASPLLNRVRQLIYNRRPPNNIGQRQFDSLWAYLNIGDRKDFIDLFPDAEVRFKIYEKFIEYIVDIVLDPSKIKNKQEGLVAQMVLARCRVGSIGPFVEKSHREIIRDIAICPDYLTRYAEILF